MFFLFYFTFSLKLGSHFSFIWLREWGRKGRKSVSSFSTHKITYINIQRFMCGWQGNSRGGVLILRNSKVGWGQVVLLSVAHFSMEFFKLLLQKENGEGQKILENFYVIYESPQIKSMRYHFPVKCSWRDTYTRLSYDN